MLQSSPSKNKKIKHAIITESTPSHSHASTHSLTTRNWNLKSHNHSTFKNQISSSKVLPVANKNQDNNLLVLPSLASQNNIDYSGKNQFLAMSNSDQSINNEEKAAVNSLRDIGMSKTNHESIVRNWAVAYGTETTQRAID